MLCIFVYVCITCLKTSRDQIMRLKSDINIIIHIIVNYTYRNKFARCENKIYAPHRDLAHYYINKNTR